MRGLSECASRRAIAEAGMSKAAGSAAIAAMVRGLAILRYGPNGAQARIRAAFF
jgi:hypothetical protein